MSTFDENRSIHKSLQNDPEMEMTSIELRKLLDDEMAKPANEMDTQLISRLMEALDDSQPTLDEQRASWNAIARKIEAKQAERMRRVVRSIAAIAAALVLVFCVTSGSQRASAFRWSYLWQWLRPVAETFGIHTEVEYPEPTANLKGAELFSETSFRQIQYTNLDDMPTAYQGYTTIPRWVPERFSFEQASEYHDDNNDTFFVLYMSDVEWLNVTVIMFHGETQTLDQEYEKTSVEHETIYRHGLEIAVYYNAGDTTLSASWIDRDASYTIAGYLSDDELMKIVDGMISAQ